MFSVFGASGFVGSHLCSFIEARRDIVQRMPRDIGELSQNVNLGHVIYCIGLTANYRDRPFDTVQSHVSLLAHLLKNYKYESFLYLSSTRVYQDSIDAHEWNDLTVNPNSKGDIYNISKILGESLCNNSKCEKVRIARLSNIFGRNMAPSNFLYDITQSVLFHGELKLQLSINSEKDYLSIQDAVSLLYKIATSGTEAIYNVASGRNTKVKEIIKILEKRKTFELYENENAVDVVFPEICTDRIVNEFSFKANSFNEEYVKFLLEFAK
jgi:nucleoside-diphosphate-sugar epimerase